MPPVGFELAIPASEPPQTLALDRSANGIGRIYYFVAARISIPGPYNL
jgi:hypothetical protein